ncbi:hypothetical protein AG1IA_01080 [Rhizoctonia solani AG-1 IA]|uniref:Uncharacterized protein n=1 Tax=Thanatephorus cucumeris (strain AG1-IA) TaxID=983506 RepID=L8X8B8_THACA|nr:hypothetical protein AG1IA_01080 [Rhizoctonia solani AG-1 IA]
MDLPALAFGFPRRTFSSFVGHDYALCCKARVFRGEMRPRVLPVRQGDDEVYLVLSMDSPLFVDNTGQDLQSCRAPGISDKEVSIKYRNSSSRRIALGQFSL